MTSLTDLIQKAALEFDRKRYPEPVYFHLITQVRNAETSDELSEALHHCLAWKDGKVRVDSEGPHTTGLTGVRYRLEGIKPNTFGAKHQEVLRSESFLKWAKGIRTLEHFELEIIREMERSFGLWSSVIIPVFVLHCLNPRVFPIVDRWVVLAFQSLRAGSTTNPINLTLDVYAEYHRWWLGFLAEAGLSPLASQLQQLKEIDAGLWALGKRFSVSRVAEITSLDQEAVSHFQPKALPGTDSIEFKQRAISIRNSGASQREAIVQAAREMGIELKPSYTTYPGSHFDRWRKQGLC